MRHYLIVAGAYLAGNAVGLLLAILVLPGFVVTAAGFLIALLLFSVVQVVAGPLIRGLSSHAGPQMRGGVSLLTVFLGLQVTNVLVREMAIGGISNWLAATLLVWLGSLAAEILLAVLVSKGTGGAGKA